MSRRTFRLNMDLVKPLLDRELRNTVDNIQPKLDDAVNEAITDYEKYVSERVRKFAQEAQDDTELRAALDKAFEQTEADFKDANSALDTLIDEIEKVKQSAENIDAAAVADGAKELLRLSGELRTKVNNIHGNARKATRFAVSSGLKALGFPG